MIEYTKDELNILIEWYKKSIEFFLNCSDIVNTVDPNNDKKYIHKKYIIFDKVDKKIRPLHLRIAISINDLGNQFIEDSFEPKVIFPSPANNYNSLCLELKESNDWIIIECFLFNI